MSASESTLFASGWTPFAAAPPELAGPAAATPAHASDATSANRRTVATGDETAVRYRIASRTGTRERSGRAEEVYPAGSARVVAPPLAGRDREVLHGVGPTDGR
ncbi:hypothetical protein [Halosimplex halobium]|uniref:hypothetical protein n=1 Tax=Halosimplex halobium TaxID=3396618 RepID=UPI003F566A82